MRQPLVLCSPLLAVLVVSTAHAADWYVSPTGTATSGCTTRAVPCDLASASNGAMPGDNVILMDGIYTTALDAGTSGTADAWITFKADTCATPIFEGPGVGPMEQLEDDRGVGSDVAEYVRFQGLVARGWNIGFGNGWADGVESEEVSNGHWEIEHCVAYSNGRTGFTFFSAEGFRLKNSISAHNGSNEVASWSSGVTLFEADGVDNLVEGVVSFENTDGENNTDGSGFIVDELSNNATFVNNVAFRNSGSCLRITDSSGTKFINNTCYHNSQFGSMATGPTNPGEIYFTNGGITQQNVLFKNNVIVGTGVAPAGSMPIQNQPPTGWENNEVTTGSVSFFTDPTGTNPNYVPTGGATELLGQGTAGNGAPTNDIGFDPKCLTKREPIMVGAVAALPGWEFDVDIDYIKSIGGVAACWHPGTRGATPDIGAYKSGTVETATVGACVPPPVETGGAGGAGGGGGGGGGSGGADGGVAGSIGSAGTAQTAGTSGSGGAVTGAGGTAGATSAAGTTGTQGGSPGAGGVTGSSGSGAAGTAGSPAGTTGGVTAAMGGAPGGGSVGVAGSAMPTVAPAGEEAGCGCRVAPEPGGWRSFAAFGAFGLGAMLLHRRRRSR